MAQEQHEPSPGFEDSCHLVDRLLERLDVLERQAHHHGVERSVAARQRLGARPDVHRSATAFTGDLDLGGGRIEAHDLRAGCSRSDARPAPHRNRCRGLVAPRRGDERPTAGSGPRTRGRRRPRTRAATIAHDGPTAPRSARLSFLSVSIAGVGDANRARVAPLIASHRSRPPERAGVVSYLIQRTSAQETQR